MSTVNEDPAFELEEDDDTQAILLAASQHDIQALRPLLRGSTSSPANVRDPDTGYSPLHSAIYACAPQPEASERKESNRTSEVNSNTNGTVSHVHDAPTETEQAVETVRYLLQNGAIWNQLDRHNETPACVAFRLELKKLYEVMVDAGVRAEMLLNRLDEYEQLDDHDSADESSVNQAEPVEDANVPSNDDDSLRLSEAQTQISAIERPLTTDTDSAGKTGYLASNLTFGSDRITDNEENGVMMSWEKDIMARSVEELVPREGLRILNIGHGMGIVDEQFQAEKPSAHHIVEAHPEVLEKMRKDGWPSRPGVVVHEGKWQQVVPKLIEEGETFDAIYFDTFGEDYKALRRFFDEFVIGLLDEHGRFSFFNGLGADRQVCYDVYAKVVEMDLLECGFDVEWTTMKVSVSLSEETWTGLKRPYWTLEDYKLPIVSFLG